MINDTVKNAIMSDPVKVSILQKNLQKAVASIATNLTVPKKWGGDVLEFSCLEGNYLTFDPKDGTKFYCSTSGTYYYGEPYSSGWVALKHSSIANAVTLLGLSYYFTGNLTHGRVAAGVKS